jgi:hypothetical protein
MEHLRTSASPTTRIVVYFADNGWYWGEHRLRAKNNPYEEAIRAPMFVRYPSSSRCRGVEARSRSTSTSPRPSPSSPASACRSCTTA